MDGNVELMSVMLERVEIKTVEEIALMRGACTVTAQILDALKQLIRPGITTEDIDVFVHNMTIQLGAIPSTLNYKGYPKSVCTSINDVICHGIPSSLTVLKSGDIINVDVTSYKNGFHGDSSRMYLVGGEDACSQDAVTLVRVAEQAMYAGISAVKPGGYVGDIGAAIREFINKTGYGYGIVREYTGHGIGRGFHEPPQVIHIARARTGIRLSPGMIFTVEPMINQGTPKTVLSKLDGWTVRTADGSLSAQWEHTVLVTDTGNEILTASPCVPASA